VPGLIQVHKLHLYFEFAAFAFSMQTVLKFYTFCCERKIWKEAFKSYPPVDFTMIYGLLHTAFQSYEKGTKTEKVMPLDRIFMEAVEFLLFFECSTENLPLIQAIVTMPANANILQLLQTRVVYLLHHKTFQEMVTEFALISFVYHKDEKSLKNIESILPVGLKWEMFKNIGNWMLAGGSVLRALSLMPPTQYSDLDIFFTGKMQNQLKQLELFLATISSALGKTPVYVLFIEDGSCKIFVENWNFHFDIKLSLDERNEFGILHGFDSSAHRIAFHPAHGFCGSTDSGLVSREKKAHHIYFDHLAQNESAKYKFATTISVKKPQLYRLESLFRAQFELDLSVLSYLNTNKDKAVSDFEAREQIKQIHPLSEFSQQINLQILQLMYKNYLNALEPDNYVVEASMLSSDNIAQTALRLKAKEKPKWQPQYDERERDYSS
jgi:hypothetical protein